VTRALLAKGGLTGDSPRHRSGIPQSREPASQGGWEGVV